MNSPLSGKQKREDFKFLFDELRKTVAHRKEQRRKDQLHNQKIKQSDEKHYQKMDVPPMMGKPMNPEAGPSDKVPALLTAGEAVIPKKAAQNPKNKPLIKAMVREGRSDVNMSVPMPKGFACGSMGVKGYAQGTDEVTYDEMGNVINYIQPEVPIPVVTMQEPQVTQTLGPQETVVEVPPVVATPVATPPATTLPPVKATNPALVEGTPTTTNYDAEGNPIPYDPVGNAVVAPFKAIGRAINNVTSPVPEVPTKTVKSYNPETKQYEVNKEATDKALEANAQANAVIAGVMKREGGFVKDDAGAGPTNFGINQRANPEVNVSKLTKEQAAAIYKTKYYDPLVTSEMSIEAKNAVVDAGVNMGVPTAKKLWEQSGGDLNKFTDLRNERYAQIAANDPSKAKYLPSWLERSNQFRPKAEDAKVPKVDTNPSANLPPITTQEEFKVPPVPTVDEKGNPLPAPPYKGMVEKYGDTIANGISDVWNTIKDPKELGSFISSFVKDTLGFNGQDAARFGLLVAGSRALGYNPTQAIRYAGNYTLISSDKRNTAAQAQKNAMELQGVKEAADLKKTMTGKGYIEKDGKWYYPPVKGIAQSYTVDNGKYRGKELNMYEWSDARGNKTLADINGKTIEQYQSDLGQPVVKMQDYHRPEMQAGKRIEYTTALTKDINDMKTEKLNDKTIKGISSNSWASLPSASVMSSQLVDASEKYGLNMVYLTDQRVANTAIRQAAEDAVTAAKGSPVKTEDVAYQFEKQMLVKGVGPTEALYKNSSNKEVQASDIVANFKQVEAKFNGDRKQTINMFTSWANEFRTNKDLRDKWEPTGTKSGFMRYVENELKQMK
jgi:hypothetical protein